MIWLLLIFAVLIAVLSLALARMAALSDRDAEWLAETDERRQQSWRRV